MSSWALSFHKDGIIALILATGLGLVVETIAEPLTGRFADTRGRIPSMVTALSLMVPAFFLMFIADIYQLKFAVGSVTLSFSMTLRFGSWVLFLIASCLFSGTAEAWVVDELRSTGDESSSASVFAPVALLENIAWIPGGLIRFVPSTVPNMPPIWWLIGAGGACWTAIYLVCNFSESPRRQLSSSVKTLSAFNFIHTAREIQRENRVLKYLALGYTISYAVWFTVAQFWLPTLKSILPSNPMSASSEAYQFRFFSILWIIFCLSRIIGSSAVKKMGVLSAERRHRAFVVAAIVNVAPIPILAALLIILKDRSYSLLIACFICFWFSKIGEEFIKPLRKAVIMDAVSDSRFRATMMSLSQASGALLMFVIYIPFSLFLLADESHRGRDQSLQYGLLYAIIGAVSIFSVWFYAKGHQELKNDKQTGSVERGA